MYNCTGYENRLQKNLNSGSQDMVILSITETPVPLENMSILNKF